MAGLGWSRRWPRCGAMCRPNAAPSTSIAICSPTRHRLKTDAETGELLQALARQQPDAGIAAILNRCGKRTGKGNTWTESRVRSHRSANGIAVYRNGQMAERGELTLDG